MKVLITGCYGYIGAHIVKQLSEEGHRVDGIDNVVTKNNISTYLNAFIHSDIRYQDFDLSKYDAVIHLAGKINVEESTRKPSVYFRNNIHGTMNLIKNGCPNLIFASTAAAFTPELNPYGRSKLCAEDLVKEYSSNYTIFRFFNVAGSNGEFRQLGKPTHLIKVAAMTVVGKLPSLIINGFDYPTKDGTCIREYIHVLDIVDGISKAIKTPANSDYECLSNGKSYSNLDVVNTMSKVSGVKIMHHFGPKRPGDPTKIIAPEISNYISSNPRSLEEMCLSAYEVEKKYND